MFVVLAPNSWRADQSISGDRGLDTVRSHERNQTDGTVTQSWETVVNGSWSQTLSQRLEPTYTLAGPTRTAAHVRDRCAWRAVPARSSRRTRLRRTPA